MVCYVPGIGTLAGIGLAAYLIWHKAIGHFLGAVGVVLEFALIIGGAAAAVVVLTWTARTIRQRRAQVGACTTCRFRCQQSIRPRPHLLVNRVDQRLAPVAGRSAAACRPTAPVAGPRQAEAYRPAARVRGPWPVTCRESVAYDGYVLSPDGVDSRPAQTQASASTRMNASM
jgi:hypothetical protein